MIDEKSVISKLSSKYKLETKVIEGIFRFLSPKYYDIWKS